MKINHIVLIVFIFGISFFHFSAFAGWMANADFNSCPRKYLPNTSGSEGPFNLESECLARIRQVQSSQSLSCARYSCVSQGSAAGTSGSAQAGHEMDEHINNAIAAGIQGKISPTDAAGLVSMGLLGNALLAPQQQKSSAEIEADRVAAERAAIERERQTREREEKRDNEVAPMFALLDPLPSTQTPVDQSKKSNFYTKGFEHASQCVSQNAGTSCSGVGSDQQQSCVNDYRAGYEAGNKQKLMSMDEAFKAGLAAGERGELSSGASDSRADGPCRTEWIENYNRGHFQGKNRKSVN